MTVEATPGHDVLQLLELSGDSANQRLDVYLERTLELCADWFSASGATLFLRDADTTEYRLAARAGRDTRVPDDARIVEGQGLAGTAIARGEPLLLRDRIETVLLGEAGRGRRQIGSSMIVPLRTRQFGPLGVLCLSRRKGEDEFSDKDLSVARTLAGQIALAVANARLFAETLTVQKELGEAKRLAEIGQMTAAIAHEIRNPLTGIRGAAQVVRALGAEAAELGQIIIEETDKLDRLCGEFLDFARPLELRLEPTSLGDVARRVADMEAPAFREAGIDLRIEIESGLPIIQMDSMRMEQVCRNILLNALQSCRKGGKVTLRAHGQGLTIEDDGEGMGERELERLFTPFFTTKPQGTGLGMSVVSKIVAAHEGHLAVSSAKGRGTRVDVCVD